MPTTTEEAPPEAKRMFIGSITRAAPKKPDRIFLYGTEGVGKTTFAAGAPKPIFVAAEDGLGDLDVDVFPTHRGPRDVLDAIETLTVEECDFETVVIDTLD